MKKILLVLMAASITINMVSCGLSNDGSKSNKNNTEAAMTKNISINEAIDIALTRVESGTVIGAEYIEDTIICYDVNIIVEATKYDVRVDANTGNVIKVEYYADKRVDIPKNIISIKDAEEVALKHVNGDEVVEVSLKTHDSVDNFNVKILKDGKSTKVKVNAFDGSILEE